MSNNKFVVGVDGGGTSTTVALYDARDASEPLTPVTSRTTGPIIVHPSHPGMAGDRIEQEVRVLAEDANRELPARALVAGLAGAGRPNVRNGLQRTLEGTGIASQVVVVTDVRIAHYDAFEDAPGLLLVSGTGSIAYGQGEDGTTERVGGWGPQLGDEGSGFDIALQGLRAIVKAEDGRGRDTRLTEEVLKKLDLAGVNELVPWIHQADRSDVASCAEEVLRVASQGDDVAQQIAGNAVQELATHVRVLRDRLGPWEDPPPVAFHGGVISPGQPLFEDVRDAVRPLDCNPLETSVDPIRGAAKMAISRRKED